MRISNCALLFATLFLGACGSSVEGVYSGNDSSWLETINFRDEGRVELTFMGMTKEGTYEIEEDRVRINNGGDISILQIMDNGCLDGGGILGQYCKSGQSAESSSAKASSSSGDSRQQGSDGLVGNRYAFGPLGDEMIFEFISSDQVRLTIEGESEQLHYEARGDKVSIEGLDGNVWDFNRRGDNLEGGPAGAVMVFQKRS